MSEKRIEGEQQTRVYEACFIPSGTGQKLMFINIGRMSPRFIDILTEWVNAPGSGRLTLIKKVKVKEL